MSNNNYYEGKTKAWLEADGWQVFSRGWPDFLALKDGKLRLVEVKGGTDSLQPSQKIMHDALKRAGLPVEIVYAGGRSCPTEWVRLEYPPGSEVPPMRVKRGEHPPKPPRISKRPPPKVPPGLEAVIVNGLTYYRYLDPAEAASTAALPLAPDQPPLRQLPHQARVEAVLQHGGIRYRYVQPPSDPAEWDFPPD